MRIKDFGDPGWLYCLYKLSSRSCTCTLTNVQDHGRGFRDGRRVENKEEKGKVTDKAGSYFLMPTSQSDCCTQSLLSNWTRSPTDGLLSATVAGGVIKLTRRQKCDQHLAGSWCSFPAQRPGQRGGRTARRCYEHFHTHTARLPPKNM